MLGRFQRKNTTEVECIVIMMTTIVIVRMITTMMSLLMMTKAITTMLMMIDEENVCMSLIKAKMQAELIVDFVYMWSGPMYNICVINS